MEVVAIDNGEVYYNSKTDSISILSEDLKEMYMDESQIKMLKEYMKKGYTNNYFEFNKNGVCKRGIYTVAVESKFEHDLKRNVIIMHDKNSLDETVITEIPYKFIDEQLHLTEDMEEFTVLYILEKVK